MKNDELTKLQHIKELLIKYISINQTRDTFEDYPIYIQKAVNWWFDCLTYNNEKENIHISDEDVNNFKLKLADAIDGKMMLHNKCLIDVDYNPCEMLAKAGCIIGKTNMMFDYPWRTTMVITEDKVVVRKGHEDKYQEIWPTNQKRVKTKKKD